MRLGALLIKALADGLSGPAQPFTHQNAMAMAALALYTVFVILLVRAVAR